MAVNIAGLYSLGQKITLVSSKLENLLRVFGSTVLWPGFTLLSITKCKEQRQNENCTSRQKKTELTVRKILSLSKQHTMEAETMLLLETHL